ncbi:MAG: hypothetical protein GY801_05605 [bacterium]|nr:hypothetical protein [bacterium]
MAVVDADAADEITKAWRKNALPEDTTVQQVSAWLKTRTEQASETWRQWSQFSFVPECLTIYLSNQCQLACSYCYAASERHSSHQTFPVIREDIALAAADTCSVLFHLKMPAMKGFITIRHVQCAGKVHMAGYS